jgi:pimeloyl-ACP methyl ester carboxylesterase
LHAWLVPASEGRPIVLFCHGNGGNISDCLGTIRILHELDLHLLIFDYRGYGESSGRPSEGGTYRDVQAAWRYLVGELGFAPAEIILFGRSLGAAVAAHLARDVRPGALILESPFISLPEIAARHYWYLPVRGLVRYRYSTVDAVEAVESPILVIHSADDEVVPIEHGRRVFDHARGPKRFLLILGAHADGFLTSGTRYTQGLRRFLEWALADPATARVSGPAMSP